MSYKNPHKYKIQKLIDRWIDILKSESKLTDEQMECMQCGICDYAPKKYEEITYFHF